ncbi:hypothetical protein, partial [Enterobacter hormaechei]|uniref:hypothetical protein n=1 Tax=Enterobacter hormaechei TaxID=158836 RepID=UPI001A7EBD31
GEKNRPRLAGSPRPAGKHASINKNLLLMPIPDSLPPIYFHRCGVRGAMPGYAGAVFFSRALSVLHICFRLIVPNTTRPARVNGTHAAPLQGRTMPGKRTVRRYEDENHTLTEKKS